MIGFAIRNLKVFFKDKASVFFSLLGVFIIIALYYLFLGDVWAKNMSEIPGVRYLMDSWIMAGLLAVTSVTTTMGAYGIMVEDKAKKYTKDFTASPIKNSSIIGGYISSAVIIGIIMSLVQVVLAEIYIASNSGTIMDFDTLIKVLGLIILANLCNSSIVLFIVLFFKSINAFSTACTIIGTLIGFLTGIYLPIGQLPETVQWVVKLFPPSHSASLFRQVMMSDALSKSFDGATVQAINEFEQMLGVTFKFGDTTIQPIISILILVITALVFYGLSILKISIKRK